MGQGRGGGGGGGAGHAAVGGAMSGNPMSGNLGGQSGVNGRFGGQSGPNLSAQGRLNTNGPNASDRDFGADRAADRSADAADKANAAAGANANSQLGGLNAAHASDTAREHAASNSRVGEIGTYEADMKSALAISDSTQRNAAITRARQKLAQESNKPLTSSAIAQLDSELKIQGASPSLGASQ
jgi:hypothetical protein